MNVGDLVEVIGTGMRLYIVEEIGKGTFALGDDLGHLYSCGNLKVFYSRGQLEVINGTGCNTVRINQA